MKQTLLLSLIVALSAMRLTTKTTASGPITVGFSLEFRGVYINSHSDTLFEMDCGKVKMIFKRDSLGSKLPATLKVVVAPTGHDDFITASRLVKPLFELLKLKAQDKKAEIKGATQFITFSTETEKRAEPFVKDHKCTTTKETAFTIEKCKDLANATIPSLENNLYCLPSTHLYNLSIFSQMDPKFLGAAYDNLSTYIQPVNCNNTTVSCLIQAAVINNQQFTSLEPTAKQDSKSFMAVLSYYIKRLFRVQEERDDFTLSPLAFTDPKITFKLHDSLKSVFELLDPKAREFISTTVNENIKENQELYSKQKLILFHDNLNISKIVDKPISLADFLVNMLDKTKPDEIGEILKPSFTLAPLKTATNQVMIEYFGFNVEKDAYAKGQEEQAYTDILSDVGPKMLGLNNNGN